MASGAAVQSARMARRPGQWPMAGTRYKDQTRGPSPLHVAKADAVELLRGGVGDYVVTDWIGHLNGLQARATDLGTA